MKNILSNHDTINIFETKNIFGVRVLNIIIQYKPTTLQRCLGEPPTARTFRKTEGTVWTEAVKCTFVECGISDDIFLTEFCSYRGHIVPRT